MKKLLTILFAFAMVLNANAQNDCGPGTYWDASVSLCLPLNNCPADLNDDGQVAVSDLLILLSAYSDVCPLIEGCTDDEAVNFNPSAEADDGSCEYAVWGCTDVSACNFNSEAVFDDGSCLYGEYIFEGCFCWYGCGDEWTDGTGGCDWIEITGCTDSEACNYDENVCEEDGSCIYPIDVWGVDYVDCGGACLNDADGDGICDEVEILGCTIDTADNYDPLATEDDGSCQIPGCIIAVACNYNPESTVDDGTCYFYCPGCTDSEACNYDSEAIQEDGTCTYPIDFYGIDYVDCEGDCLNDADGDGICTEIEILGCTDGAACNYILDATDDDGTCEYETCAGCMDEIACNYDPAFTIENETDCDYESCAGCMYEFACNYDPEATIADNASCEFGTCPGCTDSTACNYNPTITVDDGSCDYTCVGCQDEAACNYSTIVTVDDGSCLYASGCDSCSGETDGTGTVVDNDADDDGVCDEDELVGCQDGSACNYNVFATDAGACTYATETCAECSGETDGTGVVIDNDSDDDEVCDWDEVVGCQDGSACNYNAAATDAAVCTYATETCAECSGETDGTGTVIDNDADDDGVCDWDEVVGCQDGSACNYNAAATDSDEELFPCLFAAECDVCTGNSSDGTGTVIDGDADDDGVCDWDEIPGCQDAAACNYNAAATAAADCTYATACEECSGETDGTGVVISFDVVFDGYTYDLVAIGDQCWFAENLRTEHYANGDAIPGELSNSEWENADDTNLGAQAIYSNDASNLADYGRLYNWYAVDDARGLCPSGWHVPTDGEYTELTDFLGGSSIAGTQIKSSPSDNPAWDGTNTSGFSGLAGGYRNLNGGFNNGGYSGCFWSASAYGTDAWFRLLLGGNTEVLRYNSYLRSGFSVRCVRDE